MVIAGGVRDGRQLEGFAFDTAVFLNSASLLERCELGCCESGACTRMRLVLAMWNGWTGYVMLAEEDFKFDSLSLG